jgi:hypothetical protein
MKNTFVMSARASRVVFGAPAEDLAAHGRSVAAGSYALIYKVRD